MIIIENKLREILGDDYEGTKDFFKNVIVAQCPHKVFLTRRAYVLYKLFENIFGKEIKPYGTVYNTHSLPLLKKQSDGKILIVDDIIVHGRTMRNIVEKILSWGIAEERIVLWCICCSSKACNLEDLRPLLKHVIYVMPVQWEKFSDKLTRAIVQSNVGYVSFVDSYRLKGVNLSEITESENKLNWWHFKNKADFFGEYAIKSNVVWGNFIEKSISSKYKLSTCIRFYEKDQEEGILAIPFVFMPSVRVEFIHVFCCSLLKSLGVHSYPAVFKTKDPDVLALFYKWTVNTISEIVLSNFSSQFKEYCGSNITVTKCLECQESYISTEDKIDIDFSPIDVDGIISDCEKGELLENCYDVMESLMSQMQTSSDFSKVFSQYIAEMKIIDNISAKEGNERNLGIRVSDIVTLITKKLGNNLERNFEDEVRSVIISAWDCGRCAYVIETVETKNKSRFVSCLIRHGEQAFREYYSLHKNVYNAFHTFFKKTHERREPQLTEFAKYLDERYNQTAFTSFVQGLDLDNYYADLMTVLPDQTNTESIIPKTNVEDVVMFYIRNYYKG